MKTMIQKFALTFVLVSAGLFAVSAQEISGNHRFASYNVRYTNTETNVKGNAEGLSWDLRGQYVVKMVSDYDFDIVGFQEVTGEALKKRDKRNYCMAHGTGISQLETLKRELSDYSFFEYERDGVDAAKDYSYNMIAYKTARYEVLDNGCFWLSSTPDVPSDGWDPKYPIRRTCGWAKMKDKTSGEIFIFAVTHCNYAPSRDGVKGAEVIKERLSALACGLPVVLVGDFNMSRKHSDAFAVYTSWLSHAAQVAEHTSCIPEENGRIKWTTTGWTTADKATRGNEFDHIFYRGMHAHSFHIITENFGRDVNPSDHYPVVGVFSIGGCR